MTSPVTGGGGGKPTPPSPTGDTSKQKVERAQLKMYESSEVAGGRKLDGEIGVIDFQFNPKEVTIAKTVKWGSEASAGAKKAAPPQFKGPEPGKLTLEMFFDATAKHDGSVVEAVDKLFACCAPTDKTLASDKPMPPLVVFKWGAITSFPAYVTSVSAKYTLFSAAGVPIRAVCTVSLQEMPGDLTQAESDVRIVGRAQHPPGRGGRHPGIDRLWRVRRSEAVATVGLLQPDRRPSPGAAGQRADAAQRGRTRRAGELTVAPTSSGFVIEIEGSPLPADAKALLIAAYVDDSLRLPDTFVLRFRDQGRIVIAKSGAKIGSKVKVSVATRRQQQPGTADPG